MIVAAGPGFNIVLAILIFFGIFMTTGIFTLKPTVGNVEEQSPAFQAGIRKGDKIFEINGTAVNTWEDMASRIADSKGAKISVALKRSDEILRLEVVPKLIKSKSIFGEDIDRHIIGIASGNDLEGRKVGPGEALIESFKQTYTISKLTVLSVVKIIEGKISTKTLGGPIMIAQMAGDQAKEGAGNLIFFIALLSINLAILNFLPIPVLDGGHLLFFTIEAIMGKPVNMKMREAAQGVGVFLLVMLMIFVFYNDIARIFVKS
jgi:regulator of sigma E protease